MQYLKRRWAAVVAIPAALAIAISSGTAHAAPLNLPGESTQWQEDDIDDGSGHLGPVSTSDTYHEAYQSNNVQVSTWRGNDSHIWFSYRNGPAYTIDSNAHTNVAPSIVPFGDGWAAFHVGTDHRIYFVTSTNNPTGRGEWGVWTPIAGNTTAQSVSVTQLGPGSDQLILAYRGDSTATSDDQRLWWLYFNGRGWSAPQLMTSWARSPSAPYVAWGNTEGAGSVAAVHRGTDGHVYLSVLDVGDNSWPAWQDLGGSASSSPVIAINSFDDVVVSYRDSGGHLHTSAAAEGAGFSPWETDPTGWQTNVSPGISTVNGAVYLLLTGLNGLVYFRKTFNR
nr:hypothetical protein [uncultured Actinoplanes sp.]